MGTIFRHAYLRSRGAILGWGLTLAILVGYMILFYDTLAEQQEQLVRLIQSYPPELMAFFGGTEDIFSPAGYLNVEFFYYMPLILGIYAVLGGAGMLVADEESGTLDLIMAHPISRTALFAGRLLAFTAALGSILLLAYLGMLAGTLSSTIGLDWAELILPFISLLAVLLLFASLALLLSLLLPSRRMAGMTSGGLLAASFFLTSLARIDERLEPLARFSPLNYYQGGLAIEGLNWSWVGGLLAFSALFAVLSWWQYRRRDIRVGGESGWRFALPRLGSFPAGIRKVE